MNKRELRPLLVIFAAALAVRLLILYFYGMMYSWGDEVEYVERAHGVLSGYGFQQILRPPLFYYYISFLFLLFGPHLIIIGWMNIACQMGSLLILYFIAEKLYGKRAGVWSAALFGFYPPFLMYVQYGYPVIPAILLMLAALLCFVQFEKRGQRKFLCGAGLFVGMAALVYQAVLFTAAALVLGLFFICKRDFTRFLKATASFLVVLAIIVGAWTARNYFITSHFFLISVNYGNIMWKSHNTLIHYGNDYRIWEAFEEPSWYPPWDTEFGEGGKGTSLKNRPRVAGPDPVVNAQQEARNALRFIRKNPSLTFRRFGPKLSVFWSPSPWSLHYMMTGYYGPLSCTAIRAITLLGVLSYTILVLVGVVGMVFSPYSGSKIAFVLLPVIWSALYVSTYGMTRYRPPVMPVFILYAAYAVCHLREILFTKWNKWKYLIVGIFILLFIILWAPHMSILDNVFRDPFPEPEVRDWRPEVAKFLKKLETDRKTDYYRNRFGGSWRISARFDQ